MKVSSESKIGVVIVTYNRLKLLSNLLSKLEKQTEKIESILIFDNDSTDGTGEYLEDIGYKNFTDREKEDKRLYYKNALNIGGAGGFSKVIELVRKIDVDYVWIMDDDVGPEEDCLEKLMSKIRSEKIDVAIPSRDDENYSDRICTDIDMKNYKKFWTTLRKTFQSRPYNKELYWVEDMTFEGPLVSKKIIDKVGIPDSSYFIFFDDTDYARRLRKYSKIAYVTTAVLHRELAKKTTNVDRPYNWREYYSIRNNILFDKKYGETWKVKILSPHLLMLHLLVISLRRGHFKNNFYIIIKAWFDGIRGKRGKVLDPNY